MMRRFKLSFLALLLAAATCQIQAQERWSLQRCIGYAQEQNFSIKQAQANVRLAQLSESQARAARLPGVSASVNAGRQFGRTIDPTTNSFSTQGVSFNSLNLNANLPLYSGGQISHSIKQAKLDAQASEADLLQAVNNLALQVSQAYLGILLAEEQVKNAANNVAISKKQLTNTLKLIEAGNIPAVDRYNVEAQIARDEQSLIVAQNSLDLNFLNLKQLMQLEPDFDLQIETPTISAPASIEDYRLPALFATAQSTQPNMLAAQLRIRSAQEGIEVSKAGYLPTLSAFANLSSNYSSGFPDYSKAEVTGTELGPVRVVRIAGTDVPVQEYSPIVSIPTQGYFSQLDQNFGQGIGLALNVPIYQNGRVRLSVERARLAVLNAELQQNSTQQTLKNDIQAAIANVKSAKKQYEAAQKTFEASKLAFVNMEKRNTLGAVNTLDLSTAKNNMDIAENSLVIAKFDYIFRLKILDFYQGRPIVIE